MQGLEDSCKSGLAYAKKKPCPMGVRNKRRNNFSHHVFAWWLFKYVASAIRFGEGATVKWISPTAIALNILGLIASKFNAAVPPSPAERATVAHPSCSSSRQGCTLQSRPLGVRRGPRSVCDRGGRGIVMKLGWYYFLLSAKSDEMFAYPTFMRVPLPPTAHACGIPPSPEGTAF